MTDIQQNATPTDSEPEFTPSRWLVWLPVGALIAIVIGPMIAYTIHWQIAKWHLSAFEHHRLLANHDEALVSINKAVELAPDRIGLRGIRVQAYLSVGDAVSSLPDAKIVVERARRIKDPEVLANALNNSAYANALAADEQNFAQALKDAQEANQLVSGISSFIDTRGYLYYLTGDYEAALKDADEALYETKNTYDESRSLTLRKMKASGETVLYQAELRNLDDHWQCFTITGVSFTRSSATKKMPREISKRQSSLGSTQITVSGSG